MEENRNWELISAVPVRRRAGAVLLGLPGQKVKEILAALQMFECCRRAYFSPE